MNTNIEITELFLLKGLMGDFTQDDILKIREYFVKTKHRSKADSYKPGSPEHAERLAEDAKIMAMPEHEVRVSYDYFTIGRSDKLQWTKCYLTTRRDISDYWEEYAEDIEPEFEVKEQMFLVENSHWGTGLVVDFDQIWENRTIQERLLSIQYDDLRTYYSNWFTNNHIDTKTGADYKPYTLLLKRIMNARVNFVNVSVYTGESISIGEESWKLSELAVIYKAMKDDSYKFYDSNNKLITFRDSYMQDFLEFWERYSEREDV